MKIRKESTLAFICIVSIFIMVYQEYFPFRELMDWGTRLKSMQAKSPGVGDYEFYDSDESTRRKLLIDVKGGKHFWHPQVVVWVEDTLGNFIETLFITESSAKGLFISGRTAENFKHFDTNRSSQDISPDELRLVDALPYWSHQRGQETLPNFYAPVNSAPELDGMTGATPQGNFYINAPAPENHSAFNLLLEVNVAFDDNEFYSEYDFPDDSLYHGGTGLLGQPSLVYQTTILNDEVSKFQLMELIGHSHHSGRNGVIYTDLSSITTALNILDRIVVGWK